jgi:hypothetical protein
VKRKTETEEAERFLGQYEKQKYILINKLDEIQRWDDIAMHITASMGGEKVQTSGAKSPMANAVECCVDAKDEIAGEVVCLRDKQKRVLEVIESLDNPTEYRVLHDMFIKGKTHEEIAEEYGHDYSWSTTTVGRAKKNVWRLLQGEKERV